jgi:hypothetical protein
LAEKAKRLRKETGDLRYYAPIEKQKWSFIERLENVIAKPFVILVREPMLIAITAYMSVSFANKNRKGGWLILPSVCIWVPISPIPGIPNRF